MKPSTLAKKFLGTGLTRGVTAAGTLALNIYLARAMDSREEYGRIALCLTAIVNLGIFTRFGFDQTLLKIGGAASHVGNDRVYRDAVKNSLIAVAIISLFVWLVAELILVFLAPLQWHATTAMQYTLCALPAVALTYIVSSSFKAAHRPEVGALFEVGGISILTCVGVFLFSIYSSNRLTPEHASVIFTVCSCLFAACGMAVIFWRTFGKKAERELVFGEKSVHPSMPVPELREYYAMSASFAVIAAAPVFGNWCGVYLLEFFRDADAVGLYNAALRTALVPNLLMNIVVTICSPKISGFHQEKDLQSLHQIVRRSAFIVFIVNFPILSVICLASPWIMQAFGSQFADHWYLLTIIAAGQLVTSIFGVGSAVLSMSGNHQILQKIGMNAALSTVVLTALLAWLIGPTGAAIGAAFYASFQALCTAIVVKSRLGFYPMPSFIKWDRSGRAV